MGCEAIAGNRGGLLERDTASTVVLRSPSYIWKGDESTRKVRSMERGTSVGMPMMGSRFGLVEASDEADDVRASFVGLPALVLASDGPLRFRDGLDLVCDRVTGRI